MRLVNGLSILGFLFLAFTGQAFAVEARHVVTTQDADYFGFDLRSEQNLTLDQCKTSCLGDSQCRAFTYNTKAKWCFLKSDFATVKPFAGAVAGKVVPISGDPDIGAPPALAWYPSWMESEAQNMRTRLTDGSVAIGEEGLAALVEAGDFAQMTGDPRAAMQKFTTAVAILPDDGALWLKLAHAVAAVRGVNNQEVASLRNDATAAAYNAYLLSRTAPVRAEALAVLAVALDGRDMYRPALKAYEASLALVNSASVRAEYEDLKARKGFRVVDHTRRHRCRLAARLRPVLRGSSSRAASTTRLSSPSTTRPRRASRPKAKQICVGGLDHGQHYRVTFRTGLPAAIGEVLGTPVVLSSLRPGPLRPRPASPAISSCCRRRARRGIPLVTVNMDAAGHQALPHRRPRRSPSCSPATSSCARSTATTSATSPTRSASPSGRASWSIASELNKEVTTSFPVDEALPDRKPGVYVMTADAEGRPQRGMGVARHAMVRRLRHRPVHLYRPGRAQRLCPLARHRPSRCRAST